jgi:peptidoglycan hydrolase-like protein with peptidoglycan-binding domain
MEKKSLRLLVMASAFCFAFTVVGASAGFAADAAKMAPKKATMAPAATMVKKAAPDDQTMAIQKALNKEGYKLKDDGLMGKHTRAAIRSFQKKNGLKVTGAPDDETLAKLGVNKM